MPSSGAAWKFRDLAKTHLSQVKALRLNELLVVSISGAEVEHQVRVQVGDEMNHGAFRVDRGNTHQIATIHLHAGEADLHEKHLKTLKIFKDRAS